MSPSKDFSINRYLVGLGFGMRHSGIKWQRERLECHCLFRLVMSLNCDFNKNGYGDGALNKNWRWRQSMVLFPVNRKLVGLGFEQKWKGESRIKCQRERLVCQCAFRLVMRIKQKKWG